MTELATLATLPGLPFQPQQLLTQQPHESEALAGWTGLATWTLKAEDGSFWDLDWRYAYGHEIFKQHWIDFGWDEDKLLHKPKRGEPPRHKIIVYLCASDLKIPEGYTGFHELPADQQPPLPTAIEQALWHPIPERYVIGRYWQSIHRGLLSCHEFPSFLRALLPVPLPTPAANLPNGDFATTRNLQNEPPPIQNNPQDEVQTALFLPEGEGQQGEGGLRTKALYKHPGTEDSPLISVITVVYNNVALLEQTMQSVINQSGAQVEYIVIDGGSTDGTVGLIQQYQEQIDYWVSEKDAGIYDAMNKGTTTVSGKWINYLNSGDLYSSQRIISGLSFASIQLNYGSHIEIDRENNFCSYFKYRNDSRKNLPYCHQSAFFLLDLIKKYPFNTNFKIAADFEQYMRLKSHVHRESKHLLPFCIYTKDGISRKNMHKLVMEYFKITFKLNPVRAVIFFVYRILKLNLKYAKLFLHNNSSIQ